MIVIYADILFITNIYFTYFFLKAICVLYHIELNKKRIILSSILGGISSLVLLINTSNVVVCMIKLISVVLIIITAGFTNIKDYKKIIKYSLVYILINICFVGVCIAVWKLTGGDFIYIKDFTVYFDISLLALIIITIISYLILYFIDYFLIKKKLKEDDFIISFTVLDNDFLFKGIADTGNKLYDMFSGRAVIVCKDECLYKIYKTKTCDNTLKGFRLIPCETVNGSSLLPIISLNNIKIIENGIKHNVRACIGIAECETGENMAIFNPAIL